MVIVKLLLLSYTAVPGSARPCWGGSFEKKQQQQQLNNHWLEEINSL